MIHNFMSHAWPLQDIFAKDNNKEIIYNGEGVLSDEEIDSLIQRVDKNVVAGEIDTDEEGKATRIDKRTRDSNVHFLSIEDETNHDVYKKLTSMVNLINNDCYHYSLLFLQEMQYTRYDSSEKGDGFYGLHTDGNMHKTGWLNRKLSFSLQLSDPEEYTGGELMLYCNAGLGNAYTVTAPKKKGLITFFPSITPHEVKPISKGTRRSLVGWVMGPDL